MAKSKKIRTVILTANKFEDFELFFPYFRLIEEGLKLTQQLRKKEDKRYAFATNMNFTNNDVMLAERIFTPYSKR